MLLAVLFDFVFCFPFILADYKNRRPSCSNKLEFYLFIGLFSVLAFGGFPVEVKEKIVANLFPRHFVQLYLSLARYLETCMHNLYT